LQEKGRRGIGKVEASKKDEAPGSSFSSRQALQTFLKILRK
jgi:hypothetical protein